MVLGMSIPAFTVMHVGISLLAIATGLVVFLGMMKNRRLETWTAVFLVTTVATTLTGFMFPIVKLTPAIVVGAISSLTLGVAIVALYLQRLAGPWRWIYVASAVVSLYFNCFVLVVQTFQKIAFFNALAPTQQEPPFVVAQALVLVLFAAGGLFAAKRFQPAPRAGRLAERIA
jgi:hypothetical protein